MAGLHVRAFRDVRDHGAVAGFQDLQYFVLAAAHGDCFKTCEQGARAFGGKVEAGIFRIETLDEEILGVRVGGGEAPGDVGVMAENGEGHARRGGPGKVGRRRGEPRQIPDAGRGHPEMGIVGEKGGAALSMATRKRPVIGGAQEFPRPGQGVPESIEPEAVEEAAQPGKIPRIRHENRLSRGRLPCPGSPGIALGITCVCFGDARLRGGHP